MLRCLSRIFTPCVPHNLLTWFIKKPCSFQFKCHVFLHCVIWAWLQFNQNWWLVRIVFNKCSTVASGYIWHHDGDAINLSSLSWTIVSTNFPLSHVHHCPAKPRFLRVQLLKSSRIFSISLLSLYEPPSFSLWDKLSLKSPPNKIEMETSSQRRWIRFEVRYLLLLL